jgi:Papain fold toxin 1, glutamine deamidase
MLELDRSQDGRDAAVDTPSPESTPVDRDRGGALANAGIRGNYALAYRATVDAAYAEYAGRRPDADARRGADLTGANRPDMAERYPGRYARPTDPPPRVDGPGEHPERWVGGIYPGRDRQERPNNCGECARAVDTTWHGTPTAAAELVNPRVGGERPAVMSEWAGRSPEPASMADIGRRLRELGHGSSAVVGFDRADAPGHWFNAVNHEGTILAVDGQAARFEDWPPSRDGLGFDENEMSYSDAIYFTADGKVERQ